MCSQDGPGTSREVVGSVVLSPHHDAVSGSCATGDVTSSDGEHVASRRDALAQELHRRQASTEDVQPVAKKQAVARQVNSCQEVRGLVPLMPKCVPNDVMSWLQDRQADCQLLAQDVCDRVGQDDLGRGCSFDRDHDRPAIICGQHGDLVNAKLVSLRLSVRNSVS